MKIKYFYIHNLRHLFFFFDMQELCELKDSDIYK